MLSAFAHARQNSDLTALVSGDPQKLRALSRKYDVPHTYSYEQYSDCLESGEVDAVYIAVPKHMHPAYTEGAAEAGIHVLCEKPMALDEADCEAMIAAAERARIKLMIAYRLHFERGNVGAIEVIKSGKIGEPRMFTSVFSQQVKAGNSRLKKNVGGGAIYDMEFIASMGKVSLQSRTQRSIRMELELRRQEVPGSARNDQRVAEIPGRSHRILWHQLWSDRSLRF